jgi:hypothetical protein
MTTPRERRRSHTRGVVDSWCLCFVLSTIVQEPPGLDVSGYGPTRYMPAMQPAGRPTTASPARSPPTNPFGVRELTLGFINSPGLL